MPLSSIITTIARRICREHFDDGDDRRVRVTLEVLTVDELLALLKLSGWRPRQFPARPPTTSSKPPSPAD